MKGALLLVLALVTIASSTLVPGAVYVGHYYCGSYAWLMFHVEEVSDEGVQAVFHFMYPSSTQHGAYLMRGKYHSNRRIMRFEPVDWLFQSAGKVVKVGLAGIVSADGESFAGEVVHLSCGKFQLNRTAIDVEPPAHTVQFRGLGADETTHQMVMKAQGALLEEDGKARDGMTQEFPAAGRGPPRETLQMLLNGVRGLVAEARQQRQRAAAAAPLAAAAASGAAADAPAPGVAEDAACSICAT